MCLKYFIEEFCKLGSRCKFWYLCREFFEGICKGNCGWLYDFYDEDNKVKMVELGFEGKVIGFLKIIVVGSFL